MLVAKLEIQGPNVVGIKLRLLREEAKMSQRDLSKASGVSQRQISNIENGLNSCSVLFAEKLGKVFGFTGSQLIDPNVPFDFKRAASLNRLVLAYSHGPDELRDYIDMIVKGSSSPRSGQTT